MRYLKTNVFLCLWSIWLGIPLLAQPQAFVNIYGDSLFSEQAAGVIQMPDGKVYVLGNLSGTPAKGDQLLLTKFKPDGSMVWQQSYGDSLNEAGAGLAILTDSSMVITGSVFQAFSGINRAFFMRVDTSGALLQTWLQADSTRNSSFKTAAAQTDGSFLASGAIASQDGSNNNSYLHYFDAQGQSLWIADFQDSLANDIAHASATVPGGGFLVAGERQLADFSYRNYALSLNSNGQVEWDQTFDYGTNAGSQNILRTQSGDYILVGEAYPDSSTFYFDYLAICLDSSGQEKWHQFYGDFRGDACFSLAEVKPGYFMLGGYGYNSLVSNTDFFLLLIDSLGQAIAPYYWGGNDIDMALGLFPAQQGGVYAAGFTTTPQNKTQQVLWYDPLALLSTSLASPTPALDITFSPNPLGPDRTLYAASTMAPGQVYLLGMDGKICWANNISAPWHSLTLPQTLPKGMYVLRWEGDRKSITHKVIIH